MQESAKTHIRNILLQIPNYNLAYVAESCIKTQVLRIVNALKAPVSDAHLHDPTISKEERSRLAKETAQERVDMVNQLTALVYVYNDSVLVYMKAFQNLAVSVELVNDLCCFASLFRPMS